MKAWQFIGTGEPLVLVDVPEPTPADDEVLVEIRAAGLCHTDVGILHDPGWAARLKQPPLTLGHEVAGFVVAVGPAVSDYAVGDRVGISPAGLSKPGIARDGGYSSYCTAHPSDLVRVPDNVSFELAAIGTDAGRASYRAVMVRGGVKPGDKLGVIGLGGLGQVGARIAVLNDVEVYVAEVKESLWPLAAELGAKRVAADISEFADAPLDVIVDFAGYGTTTAAAIETVRPFGTVVQVGMGRLEATIPTSALIFNQVTLVGSRGGTIEDIVAVYDLLGTGALSPRVSRIGFHEIPAALERLHRGEADGRYVAVAE